MFDLHTISFLLIFIAAGLVKGVTGMGLPTVAMGLLGLLMPPQAAAALLVLPSLLTNLWQLLAGPALAQIVRRLWLMMTGIIIGTLAGSSLLIGLNPRWSALALGAALIVYAGYALCSPVFQVSGRVEKWLSPLMGGLTGGCMAIVGAGAVAGAARHVAGTADPLASQPAALSSGLSVVPAGAGDRADRPGMAGLNPLAAGNVLHIVLTGVLVDL